MNGPLIARIRRHSATDGPGIRTVIFFKGCPLRCLFCHNPETQDPDREPAFFRERCLDCGSCRAVCPAGAAADIPAGIRREMCLRCGRCAGVCPGGAIGLIGRFFTVTELVEIILKDRAFYRHSGGGVTLSGGEPLLHPGYVKPLAAALKENGLHLVLQTAGHFAYRQAQDIFPLIDKIQFDLKLADPRGHREVTGVTNHLILENLKRLLREFGEKVKPRIPLIPGITANRENLAALVQLLAACGAEGVALLPYNPLGLKMTATLGRAGPPLAAGFLSLEEETAWGDYVGRLCKETLGGIP